MHSAPVFIIFACGIAGIDIGQLSIMYPQLREVLSIQPTMKISTRRQWYARFLLSIFVPILLIASVHVHQQETDVSATCYSCQHHLHHSGHLTTATFHSGNCVLCSLLTMPYVAATVVALTFFAVATGKCRALPTSHVHKAAYGVTSLRAPPVLH